MPISSPPNKFILLSLIADVHHLELLPRKLNSLVKWELLLFFLECSTKDNIVSSFFLAPIKNVSGANSFFCEEDRMFSARFMFSQTNGFPLAIPAS